MFLCKKNNVSFIICYVLITVFREVCKGQMITDEPDIKLKLEIKMVWTSTVHISVNYVVRMLSLESNSVWCMCYNYRHANRSRINKYDVYPNGRRMKHVNMRSRTDTEHLGYPPVKFELLPELLITQW